MRLWFSVKNGRVHFFGRAPPCVVGLVSENENDWQDVVIEI